MRKERSLLILMTSMLLLSGCTTISEGSNSDTSIYPTTSDSSSNLPNSDSYINSYDQYVYNYSNYEDLMGAPKIIAQDNYSFQSLAIEFEVVTNYRIVVSVSNQGNPWHGIQSMGEGKFIIEEQEVNIGYYFITYDYDVIEEINLEECVLTLDTETQQANYLTYLVTYRNISLNSINVYANESSQELPEIDYSTFLKSKLTPLTNDVKL